MVRDGTPTSEEVMVLAAANALRGMHTCFVGVGLPCAASVLAQQTHSPDLVLVFESGVIGARPGTIPLSIGDPILAETAIAVVGLPEIFNYWLQGGRIDVGFLGAAQIDRYCNINTTVIGGSYAAPSIRLPGAGGASEIAASCREVFVLAPHDRRRFVAQVDFVTSVGFGRDGSDRTRHGTPGGGPSLVVTDLGLLRPNPETKELELTAVHHGVEIDDVLARTGWPLRVIDDLVELAPPAPDEVAALRKLRSAGGER